MGREDDGDRLIRRGRGNCLQTRLVKLDVLERQSSTSDLTNVSHRLGLFVSESRHARRRRSIFLVRQDQRKLLLGSVLCVVTDLRWRGHRPCLFGCRGMCARPRGVSSLE